MKEVIKNYSDKVDKKLKIRQIIFFIIISILTIINVTNITSQKIGIVLALSGFLLATLLGIALSRMFKIFWHEEKAKVISELDTLGIVLLILYITIEIGRKWFFSYWLSGDQLTSFSLIILTGLLLGRFTGTAIKIKIILNKNNSLS